ncbi:MAG: DUF4124 domain-containing protein [Arenimonas sp.]
MVLFLSLVATIQADLILAAEPKVINDKVMIYRCLDAKGKVSLQDSPCAKSSKQESREMARPKDAIPAKNSVAKPVQVIAPTPATQNSIPLMLAPPDLYQCTNYEGKTRDSENYDTNPRCEPLWAQGYRMEHVPFEQRAACSWVQDSCVRYEGSALCDRWKAKKKQAESDLRYAFSDTAAFRKSDLARISQIVRRSCQ